MKMAAGTLLGVLLLSSAALPYWGGIEAEKHYRALLQRLRSESLGSLDVHETFERGWLHSTAETRVSTGAGGWITLRHAPATGERSINIRALRVVKLRNASTITKRMGK